MDRLVDTQTGMKRLGQAGRCSNRMQTIGQHGRRSDAERRLDCQADARNPYRQDGKHLERLVDIQTGMKTLGQAGRRSDRMANT